MPTIRIRDMDMHYLVDGDSYHVSASHAKRCAEETLAFIRLELA